MLTLYVVLTKEQKETRLLQIDQRLSRLSKIIDSSHGMDEGLQEMYEEFMDERDMLVHAKTMEETLNEQVNN